MLKFWFWGQPRGLVQALELKKFTCDVQTMFRKKNILVWACYPNISCCLIYPIQTSCFATTQALKYFIVLFSASDGTLLSCVDRLLQQSISVSGDTEVRAKRLIREAALGFSSCTLQDVKFFADVIWWLLKTGQQPEMYGKSNIFYTATRQFSIGHTF